jgi:hypothetical protein
VRVYPLLLPKSCANQDEPSPRPLSRPGQTGQSGVRGGTIGRLRGARDENDRGRSVGGGDRTAGLWRQRARALMAVGGRCACGHGFAAHPPVCRTCDRCECQRFTRPDERQVGNSSPRVRSPFKISSSLCRRLTHRGSAPSGHPSASSSYRSAKKGRIEDLNTWARRGWKRPGPRPSPDRR